MAIPVTGDQHPIAAGDYSAVITELGAGLRELTFQGQPVIAGHGADELPPGAAGQLLVPWPNRVDAGRYRFSGADHQLDLSEPARGNAIHGLTRWLPWTAAGGPSETVLRVRLAGRPGYPFCLDLQARYLLQAEHGLRVEVTARNVGSRPAPYGIGAHPYLVVDGPAADEWELDLPAQRWLAADDRGIPVGPARDVAGGELDFRGGRAIGGARLDHALTGLSKDADGRAWARLSGARRRVALWAGPGYDWLQVFTGDSLGQDRRRRAVAIEPMTCPPNALASGDGLIVLDPGERVSHAWGILAGGTDRG